MNCDLFERLDNNNNRITHFYLCDPDHPDRIPPTTSFHSTNYLSTFLSVGSTIRRSADALSDAIPVPPLLTFDVAISGRELKFKKYIRQ